MSNEKKKNNTIKIATPSILKEAEQHALEPVKEKSGRKALPKEEKASERVTLTLTPKELATFINKANGFPLGSYLKNYIVNNTDLLKE
jgi:hypothetical protein